MARKLPWTASANTNKQPASRATSTNARLKTRVKAEVEDTGQEHEQASSPIKSGSARRSSPISPADNTSRRRPRERSLSTSPPPAPPPIELMRPGLDEDDIYVLVEDEFQAIAQSYTAHLHHAEYKRLMKLAKERKAEQQRTGTDLLARDKIPDNVSGETRQRLKRKLLSERQSSGVKSMLGRGLLHDTDNEDSDGDEAQEAILAREEKKVGDMWAGTALGGLMRWDHSQERPSLKGLEKLGGETRASKGFGPSGRHLNNEGSKTTCADGTEQEVKSSGRGGSSTSKALQSGTYVDRRSTTASTHTETAPKHSGSTATTNKKTDAPQRGEPSNINLENKPNKPTRSKYRSFIDSLDDFDDEAFDATQAARQSDSPEKLRSRPGPHDTKKQKKDRKDRLDEVPVFLI